MNQDLKGRVALVTGSVRNLGRAMAVTMARHGAAVVVNGHGDQGAIDQVVDEIRNFGGQAIGIRADVGIRDEVFAMVRQASDAFGKVDIAISNVSVRRPIPFLELTEEDWQHNLRVNLSASVYLAQAVLPGMRAQKFGRIIHIVGNSNFFVYAKMRTHVTAAKAGVHGLTKSLAQEFGSEGITVNTVSPGLMDTERDWSLYRHELKNGDPNSYLEDVPAGRWGHPDEVAATCLFLAGNMAGYISGQVIHVNGARHVGP